MRMLPISGVPLRIVAAVATLFASTVVAEDPGITVHRYDTSGIDASALLTSARVDPLCVRHGIETFAMTIGLVDPTDIVEVRVHVNRFRQGGVVVDPIVLRDDGLVGDQTAGDGIYTAAGLEFDSAPNVIGNTLLRFTDVDLVHTDMTADTYREDLALAVLYIQPTVPIPDVVQLAADLVATPHVASIATPLSGDFPSLTANTTAVTQRYYDFFPDDRDFLFLGRMFNTGGSPAASFSTVRNSIQGIGMTDFDWSSSYGSDGVLQGIMNIYWGNTTRWNTLNHELLHRWAAFLDPSLDLAAPSGALNPGHWGAIELPTSGFGSAPAYSGVHDHYEWVTGTEYRGWLDGDEVEPEYNSLELYLMGLIGFDDLDATIPALVEPVFDRYEYGAFRYTYYFASDLRNVPAAEIVAVEGARIPDETASQRDFKSGTIVIYDRLMSPTEMAFWEYAQAEYELDASTFHTYTFHQATGARAGLTTYVPLVAGSVPDGDSIPGTPLRVGKTALDTYITLIWAPSCRSTDTDHVVYQGAIGDYTSHVPVTCSTNGSTAWTFETATGSSYYLVAPRNARSEGSQGTDGDGAPRTGGTTSCLPREIGVCM